jgi:antitoxin (DNA-binding transcriptional repressor) of toxin-antitoxin stability system
MHHMKKASFRDLRYRFSKVEDLLRNGEEIHITKRRRVVARLLPPEPPQPAEMPDFLARQRKMFGKKTLEDVRSRTIGRGARSLLIAYADTSFLFSLYVPDAHSRTASVMMRRTTLRSFAPNSASSSSPTPFAGECLPGTSALKMYNRSSICCPKIS